MPHARQKPTIAKRRNRVALLFVSGVILVLAAVLVRLREGSRDSQLDSLSSDELAALAHLSPNDGMVHVHLAKRLFAESRYAAARNEYATAVHLDPESARARYGYGESLLRSGHGGEAEEQFEAALKLDPRMPEAEYALGRLYSLQGRSMEALAHARRAAALQPNNDRAWYVVAQCYIDMNQDADALDSLRNAIALHGHVADYYASMGEVLARLGQLEPALDHFNRALQIDPNHGEACAQAGKFLVANPPGPDASPRAEELLKRATGLPTRRPAEVWFDLGRLYLQTGRPALAETAVNRAIGLDPHDERFYYTLVAVFRSTGKRPDAEKAERRFREISRLHSRMEHLSATVEHAPDNIAARLQLARTCRDLQLWSPATRHYSLYLEKAPSDQTARHEYEEILRTVGVAPPSPPISPYSAAGPNGQR